MKDMTLRSSDYPNPKIVDQPEFTDSGNLTQNGRFYAAAQEYKAGAVPAERVRVYEKIRAGIWSYNGLFSLVDAWRQLDGRRMVFTFRLQVVESPDESREPSEFDEPSRLIPTRVKLDVWKRDKGRCVLCGATADLHFDHVIPFSRGGTSLVAENIQLLCARHNLEKRDRIQ